MQALLREGARNLIFTSGTLSPLNEYILNLGLDKCEREPVELTGDHVINKEQLFVGTLTKTATGTEMKNIFKNRQDANMFGGMGTALANIKNFSQSFKNSF